MDSKADDGVAKRKKSIPKVAALQKEFLALTSTLQSHSEQLDALKEVPSSLNQLQTAIETLQGTLTKQSQGDETADPDGRTVQVDDEISTLLKSRQDSTDGYEPENSLLDILGMTQPENEYGQDLNESVAESLSRLGANKISKEAIERWRQSFKTPANCKTLGVPRVNTEIWHMLPQSSKQSDLAYQQLQQLTSLASVAMARVTEKIFTSGHQIPDSISKEVMKLSMEASSILGHISQEFNKKRKQSIKPVVSKDFAGIFTNQTAPSELLFGENLQEQLRASKSAAALVKSTSVKPSRSPRFSPYYQTQRQSLNSYRPFRAGRGNHLFSRNRPYRRTTSQSTSRFQSSQQ